MGAFEPMFAAGTPSLVDCDALTVKGPVKFGPGVVCRGRVTFVNASAEPRTVAPGVYADTETAL
jgi:hypothetical protein